MSLQNIRLAPAVGCRRAVGGEIPRWSIIAAVMQWTVLEYLQAGAYTAIMLAVLGVPQMLSSYFDLRARRLDRMENEANTERRHREALEERRLEEERRRQEEERRRQDAEAAMRREEERRRQDAEAAMRREEERRRQDAEAAERRHQELLTMIAATVGGGRNQGDDQSELLRNIQQTMENLQAEVARLRQHNGNTDAPE